MPRQLPDDRIVRRAITIWQRAMRAPSYDNGDASWHGLAVKAMAHETRSAELQAVNDLEARIERFGDILFERVTFQRDHDEQPRSAEDIAAQEAAGARGHNIRRFYFFDPFLNVDYNPCEMLAQAATEAGLPASVFSWKSSVTMDVDRVSVSFGYRAPRLYHYPLPDGRWMITSLSGARDDMQRVTEAALAGRLEVTIET